MDPSGFREDRHAAGHRSAGRTQRPAMPGSGKLARQRASKAGTAKAAAKLPVVSGTDVTLLLVKTGVFCPYAQNATVTVLSSTVLGANHPAPLTITEVPLGPVARFRAMDGWVTVNVAVATRPMLSCAVIMFTPSVAAAGTQTVVGLITPWVSSVMLPGGRGTLPVFKMMLPNLQITNRNIWPLLGHIGTGYQQLGPPGPAADRRHCEPTSKHSEGCRPLVASGIIANHCLDTWRYPRARGHYTGRVYVAVDCR